jgi:hypothetical protein
MKNKLVVVTDLGRLKAYRVESTPQNTPHLELLKETVFEEAHHRLLDLITDQSGRNGSPTQKRWGAPISDDHNLRLEFTRRLLRRIADQIEGLLQTHGDEGCWLATPKEIQHQLLEQLSPACRDRIEKMLPRDLTKAGLKDLLEQFLQTPASTIHA